MLREIKNVKQEAGVGRRRWFESEGLEVVFWLDERGGVTGFQMCYDLGGGERALTWRPEGGFVHSLVDTGGDTPLKNLTPVLVPDGEVPWRELEQRFAERSGAIEPEWRDLVRAELEAGGKSREREKR